MKTLYWDAINPITGLPFTWDDPNLRCGDPSYYLEPGDPGFTPYTTLSPTTPSKTKTKRMKRQAYYPSRTSDQIVWLENFHNKLAAYQAVLPLTAAQVAAGIADARWLIYILVTWLPAVRSFAQSCTEIANAALTGPGGAQQALTIFTPPAPPSVPAPAVVSVAPGALDRIFALIALIKDSAGYTPAIGQDLELIGSAKNTTDFNALQPILTANVLSNGVFLGWNWQGNSAFLDVLEIQVDRGSGWVHLASDTTPDYTDTTAFPATLTKWKYRAIYCVGGAQVGLWSPTVEVAVGG